jgi:23S rRNA (uridine2552-2'-O)-methyltransferase
MAGDVFDQDMPELLSGFGMPDGITSDMAPATTGARTVDHYRSVELAEQGLALAENLVKKGGFYLCKVFDGPDLPVFRKRCGLNFSSVKVVKPKSSRPESVELFLLCLKRK